MKLFLVLLGFLVFTVAWSACGDRICEQAEIGSCADCALTTTNYVCDAFTSNPGYDPDCNTTVGQTCYNAAFTYSSGRSTSCFPGNCSEGSGCTSSCSVDAQCASGFCSGGTCIATCNSCQQNTTNYEVEPLSTAIYLGTQTFVSFRVNRLNGPTLIPVSTQGPCTLEADQSVDVSSGFGVVIVRISECQFAGVGSVKLTVNSEANGTVHFLSYPALKFSLGEPPRGIVGFSSMSSNLNGVPMEVRTWVG